ncbi:MAG: ice-binding family protein, partial [Ferruginibacter sp.]
MKKTLLCVITAIAAFSFPQNNYAQAPPLGTSASFVLFSSNGAVTNGGVLSILTGNVGTNGGGSTTGFGNVNGVMHTGDLVTAQSAADLLIAYNLLNSAIPTNALSPLLGNGQKLNAGVFDIGSAASLNLDLTLDGQGNANAVFIFKINGGLSTNAASKVKLINGALACNVFWKVEGLVDMSTQTFMRGTVIANNAAIVMHTKDTLEGRVMSTTGAVTVDGILAYTPIGCGSITLTGPVAPQLGSTACYALFSGSGNVTNSSVTNVTGDVGTNVGVTSGFNSSLVNGTIHSSPDASTAQSASDLTVTYNYLSALTYDIELLFPPQFGNELILTPHTYLLNSATALTDTVYLNAQGNINAVFVIKIVGAFTTSVNSNVKLINGAQAKNVYWLVEGAIDISSSSKFNGTIVGNNGVINIGTGASVQGRVFATSRALNTAGITAISPTGDCRLLPVNWLYFRGKPVQQNVSIEWGTTNEMNNGYFTIEKSMDGQRFEILTTVNATKAIGAGEQNYSFLDRQPFSFNYYRISQTDKDGQMNPYKIIQVKMNINAGLNTLHYVQGNYIYVQTSNAVPGAGTLELYSIDGKKMTSQKISLTKETSTYKIERSLNRGMYLIYIQSNGQKLYTGKVMV